MALFKKHMEENVVKIENKFQNKDVLTSFIKAIVDLGDYDDYKEVSLKAAELFFEYNKNIFNSLRTISADNLNVLVDLLNCFFSNYKLGNIEMKINEIKGEVFITHYNSPFINAVTEYKCCVFLVEFYRILFKFILNEKINIEETECGINNEKCIFKITG